jgi:hypothetical protein
VASSLNPKRISTMLQDITANTIEVVSYAAPRSRTGKPHVVSVMFFVAVGEPQTRVSHRQASPKVELPLPKSAATTVNEARPTWPAKRNHPVMQATRRRTAELDRDRPHKETRITYRVPVSWCSASGHTPTSGSGDSRRCRYRPLSGSSHKQSVQWCQTSKRPIR